VNNLHIITLYKLQNKRSCESRLSSSSCRDVTSPVEFGLIRTSRLMRHALAPISPAVDKH